MILGPILSTIMLVTAPESPRYLVKKGKLDSAISMLARFHANGDRDDALVKWELEEIELALEEEEMNKKSSYVSSNQVVSCAGYCTKLP
jgi:hypothetical protein